MSTLDLSDSVHLIRMPTTLEVDTFEGRFAARFDYRYQALTVLATESGGTWTVSKYPGLSSIDANDLQDATYQYTAPNFITVSESALITALDTAGYTITGSPFTSGFSTGFEG